MFKGGEIIKFHQYLNKIYEQARELTELLQEEDLNCRFLKSSHNYLQDSEGQYHLQHYPIPVIEIVQIGDIGFNLDKIFFEFPLSQAQVINLDLTHLLEENEVEIYGGKDCTIDFYRRGDSWENVKNEIARSSEEVVMLSIYIDYGFPNQFIMKRFLDAGKFLGFK